MKKFIATALCLTIASPCFAVGRYDSHYPMPRNNMPPRYEYRYDQHHNPPAVKPCSQRTKALAVVAGVGVAAAIISAIID